MADSESFLSSLELNNRLVILERVEVKKKTRKLDGNEVVQVGLFARSDLSRPLEKGSVILTEKAIASFSEIRYGQSHDSDVDGDCGEELDVFRECLRNMSPEQRNLFNSLPIAPEFQNGGNIDDLNLERWWTNRFLLRLGDKNMARSFEAVYQHCSAIDHSCFNANARAILSGDTTIYLCAERDIHAGEEILIHYDYDEFHDKKTGRRSKAADSIHSDLWINRGFYCEDCVFEGGSGGSARKQGRVTKLVLPDLRRKVLQAVSHTASSYRKG
ncbi:hypothetical protein DFH27DRAFT_35595 [Peziza echinospora]|nr:hypothetical protein DFH27DRAFT_35595 [Peziza echinospora]